ncbi:MAG: sporulation initiation factor Spo0A C-terminal domain-containing protein [Oscillospiraceae bacterium]
MDNVLKCFDEVTNAMMALRASLMQRNAGEKRPSAASVLAANGFRRCGAGFNYLCKAVELYRETSGKPAIGKLYEEVAESFGTTAQRVERGIRHVIEKNYKEHPEYLLFADYGKKPPNREIIAALHYEWVEL